MRKIKEDSRSNEVLTSLLFIYKLQQNLQLVEVIDCD